MSDCQFNLSFIVSVITCIFTGLSLLVLYTKLSPTKEVYYKDQADKIFRKYEPELKDLIDEYKYQGGKNKIFNQLLIEKLNFNKYIVDEKYKKYKQKITYYVKEKDDSKWVKTWYLK